MTVDEQVRSAVPRGIGHYSTPSVRNHFHPIARDIVNQTINKAPSTHPPDFEEKLKKDGCLIFDNFLNATEIEEIKSLTKNVKGYNSHVPKYSDKILRDYDEAYPYNTLCYPPDLFLKNKTVVEKIANRTVISLAQSYLGCFPTLYSLNCWWHKFTGQPYGTQKDHRDYDDFRFLAFFIYLTDIDEDNGPHVFHPATQDGSPTNGEVIITGKAGTAILADTFALHRGQPLKSGQRLLLWWRYGLFVNDMHFHDENYKYKIKDSDLFKNIPDTKQSRHLFRAFQASNSPSSDA